MENENYKFYEDESGSSLSVLISGSKGWLMFLRYSGDAGFSSRNPDYRGAQNATSLYRIDNGQLDEYPDAWTCPLAILEKAILEFQGSGLRPKDISWHDDSESDQES